MTERFEAVEQWLDRVLDLSAEDARRLLDEQCDDAGVRREVLELLGYATRSGDAMEVGVGRAATELIGELEPVREGVRIGPYVLQEPLGEGGMGVVYRGARADGEFDQEVAVKVLRSEMRGSLLAERFAREREILATLDHPNIAKLFDGGTTADGQPYFVLELIRDAEPLIASCDRRELDLQQRIEVMQQVCAAVDSAHRSLIVHRDLKSSNVLVNGVGDVKLVDFGIAKLTDEDMQSTRTAPLMSPLTASPEQVLGQPITVASDVYQLGLLLYELLCGQHAHRVSLEQRSGQQQTTDTATPTTNAVLLARSIAEDDILPPSRAARRADPELLAETARQRAQSSGRGLEQALAGELDAVVLKALHKEPTRRYASARELADDLGRWLRREPVLAAPDSRGYRLRKWTQRNPVLAGVSSLAALTLLALGTLTGVFVVDQRRQAEALRLERDRALQAQTIMSELFAAASPVQNDRVGDPVTAAEILDRGAERLRQRFRDERSPLFADALVLLADSNSELGRFEISYAQLLEALELALELRDHPLEVRILIEMAWLHSLQYDFDEAARRIEEATDKSQTVRELPLRDRERLDSSLAWMKLLACDDCPQEQLDEHLRSLLELQEAAQYYTLDPAQIARAHRQANDLEGAIAIYEEQLLEEDRLAPADVSVLLNNLAYARKLRGDYDGSETAYRRALALAVEQYGEEHPNSLTVHSNLAGALSEAGRYEEAIGVLEERLEVVERAFPGHWRLGSAHQFLAFQHLRNGDSKAAEQSARTSLDIYVETLGPEHDWLVQPILFLGLALTGQGRTAEAEVWFSRAETAYRDRGIAAIRGGAGALTGFRDAATDLGLDEVANRFESLIEELSADSSPN